MPKVGEVGYIDPEFYELEIRRLRAEVLRRSKGEGA
jgi:hypothetical protein